jgi:hypothetical protein
MKPALAALLLATTLAGCTAVGALSNPACIFGCTATNTSAEHSK